MSNKTYLMVLGSSLGITLLAGAVASNPNIYAASQATSATATVTVSATCSMTGTVVTPHTATVYAGSYTDNIGKTRLAAMCNDASGFSIYAVGFTGGQRGQTMLHSDAIGSNYDIDTGVSGSGSEWSMKVDAVTSGDYTPYIDNGFSSYSLVPTQYRRVAYVSSLSSATNSASVDTTYAVRIGQQQPAGTYEGQVKYILVHPSGDVPSELPTMQTVANWGETVLENEEVTAIDTRDNQTYTVARFCVAKTNGECTATQLWMTQNLNFAPDTTKTYTHADTDLGWTTNDSSATWQPNSTLANPARVTNFSSGSPSNSVSGWTNDYNVPYYAEGKYYSTSTGFTTDEIIVYNGAKYQGIEACKNDHTQTQCEHYQVGNYYNWPAAIASNNASSITAKYAVAPDSVCPAGWRLPKGLTNPSGTVVQSEFNALLSAAGITNGTDLTGGVNVGYTTNGWSLINTSPYYFVRSGDVDGSTLYNFTTYGLYWSSSAVSSEQAYSLGFSSDGVWPAVQNNRFYGWSLRCVAR